MEESKSVELKDGINSGELEAEGDEALELAEKQPSAKKLEQESTKIGIVLDESKFWGDFFWKDEGFLSNEEAKQMDESCPYIKAAKLLVVAGVMSLIGKYFHPRQEVREYMEKVYANMQYTWRDALAMILDRGIAYGYGLSVIVYESAKEDKIESPLIRRGDVLVRQVKNLPSYNISFLPDKYGNMETDKDCIKNEVGLETEHIKPRYALHYRHRDKTNPYGMKDYRAIYGAWKGWIATYRFLINHMGRRSELIPVVKAPPSGEKDPTTNIDTNIEAALKIARSIRNDTGIAIPSLPSGGSALGKGISQGQWDIDMLDVTRGTTRNYIEALAKFEMDMMVGLLCPPDVLHSSGEVTAKGVGVLYNTFLLNISKLVVDLLDTWQEQFLRKVISYRFPGEKNPGSHAIKSAKAIDAAILQSVLGVMTNFPLIFPPDILYNIIRYIINDVLEVPEASESLSPEERERIGGIIGKIPEGATQPASPPKTEEAEVPKTEE